MKITLMGLIVLVIIAFVAGWAWQKGSSAANA